MGVTYRNHGMTTVEVQVLLALVVPHLAAFALHDVHIEERIYVE